MPRSHWGEERGENWKASGWVSHQLVMLSQVLKFPFFFSFFLNWSIVDLQCFRCTAKWFSYIYIYIYIYIHTHTHTKYAWQDIYQKLISVYLWVMIILDDFYFLKTWVYFNIKLHKVIVAIIFYNEQVLFE